MRVVSVNVGQVRTVEYDGGVVTTGIWKEPVDERLAVRGVNVEGDDQADRSVHGGVDKAVYSYASEDYEWWSGELGREVGPGTFGENLTIEGIDLLEAVIGQRWRVGTALLEVSEPRFPCFKLGIRMDDPRFLKRFANARRPGSYLRISEEGEVGAGDAIEIVSTPGHGVTIGEFNEAYLGNRPALRDLLRADELSQTWRDWIEDR